MVRNTWPTTEQGIISSWPPHCHTCHKMRRDGVFSRWVGQPTPSNSVSFPGCQTPGPRNQGNAPLSPWKKRHRLGFITREGNGTPLQYSCLENPMDGGAWWAVVHGVATSRTQLSDFTFMHWRRKWQPTPVFLPEESQGRGSLVGCRLWGRTESDTTEAT